MVKELMHDPIFLGLKSETATAEDLQVAQDLPETLVAHKETCVGRRPCGDRLRPPLRMQTC